MTSGRSSQRNFSKSSSSSRCAWSCRRLQHSQAPSMSLTMLLYAPRAPRVASPWRALPLLVPTVGRGPVRVVLSHVKPPLTPRATLSASDSQRATCVICLTAERTHAALPCGHFAYCRVCLASPSSSVERSRTTTTRRAPATAFSQPREHDRARRARGLRGGAYVLQRAQRTFEEHASPPSFFATARVL